ncbi:MAG: SAM-dependent chlorinase/fluorinase [Acidobacteria bacterium]|nr:SAM-dependent chlorinase/fluorinase [Acidobacteriota bacterium]
MATRRPLITLTSDFGSADHFVGAMKGVILSICPGAQIVDITHELRPYEIAEAAFTFGEAWRWFPKGTIHVAIVDPGVGSARRPIVAEAAGHLFVAPDNGILTSALAQPKAKAREVTKKSYFLRTVSTTFHGRDVFAPLAAHLAAGVRPAIMGDLVADALRLRIDKPGQTSKRQWTGTILKIDRFGNVITNFKLSEFPWIATNRFVLTVGFEQVSVLAGHYAECEYGELYAIAGSSGYIEIVLRESSAARKLGVAAGAPVDLMGWAREDR